ncbi:MAG: hypothetical protein HYV26_08885 [Candidatus Hydrogenedentes bacterium]|nr:hypothetical protein [Candidatus Hydrogenedentota bacterium]
MIRLAPDFKEFLRLLNSNDIAYLLIGGYAVGIHGYPRSTLDLDVWVSRTAENARRLVSVLTEFGFGETALNESMLTEQHNVVRMGLPPIRIELLTSISGVEFDECYPRRIVTEIDGIPVKVIGLQDLKLNKQCSGRLNDLNDLKHLP